MVRRVTANVPRCKEPAWSAPMKWLSVAFYCFTGVYAGMCALYVLAAYANGLAVAWWTNPLMGAWLVASVVLVLAGIGSLFYTRAAASAVIGGASVLCIVFLLGLVLSIKDIASSLQSGSDFHLRLTAVLCGMLIPFLLCIGSLWIAFTTRNRLPSP
jgi:hypothetical protein